MEVPFAPAKCGMVGAANAPNIHPPPTFVALRPIIRVDNVYPSIQQSKWSPLYLTLFLFSLFGQAHGDVGRLPP